MAPNRSRSNSNVYQNSSNSPNIHRQPSGSRHGRRSHPIQAANTQPIVQPSTYRQQVSSTPKRPIAVAKDVGMSPAARYRHNLKVLRRHDPSIASIFDQFSHVCLYHHNGVKWEKKGYEGSMFLFEREGDPKYGFFILNRMGMDDYIQCISPMDDMEISDEYLMYRSHSLYSPVHRHTPVQSGDQGSSQERHGKSEIIGLWMFATDAREPMNIVMMRLYSFVQKNMRYPDEFRYGPGRKPPPNPNAIGHRQTNEEGESETGETSMDISDGEDQGEWDSSRSTANRSTVLPSHSQSQPEVTQPSGMSEIDILFAKLAPGNPTSPPPASSQVGTSEIMDLLNGGLHQPLTPASQPQPRISVAPPSPKSTRGLALLDTIFASVVPSTSDVVEHGASVDSGSSFPPPPSAPPSTRLVHAEPQPSHFGEYNGSISASALEIHSPKPSTAALPQILTADVIHELMGLPTPFSTTRSVSVVSADSASPAPYSTASPRMRAGGEKTRERNRRRPRGGYVADQGDDEDGVSEVDASGLRLGPGGAASPFLSVARSPSGHSSLKGDATPRARPGRGLEPERSIGDICLATGPAHNSTPPPADRSPAQRRQKQEANLSARCNTDSMSGADDDGGTLRPPFQAGSELWPHAQSLPTAHGTQGSPVGNQSFNSAGSVMVVGDDADDEDVLELDFSEIAVLADMKAFEARGRANGKGAVQSNGVHGGDVKRKQRQTKKKDEGEVGEARATQATPDIPAPAAVAATSVSLANGADKSGLNASRKSKAKDQVEVPGLSEVAKDAILGELQRTSVVAKPKMEKNEFVREVLTLIHTDKSFVDRLYQGYRGLS